jgi:hypothetical protein
MTKSSRCAEFPFSASEWHRVQQATTKVLNATLANDAVLCTAQFVELSFLLAELRNKYGEHPILRRQTSATTYGGSVTFTNNQLTSLPEDFSLRLQPVFRLRVYN